MKRFSLFVFFEDKIWGHNEKRCYLIFGPQQIACVADDKVVSARDMFSTFPIKFVINSRYFCSSNSVDIEPYLIEYNDKE